MTPGPAAADDDDDDGGSYRRTHGHHHHGHGWPRVHHGYHGRRFLARHVHVVPDFDYVTPPPVYVEPKPVYREDRPWRRPVPQFVTNRPHAGPAAGDYRRSAENPAATCLMTREYQVQIAVGGELVPGYGLACLQPDGSWYHGPAVPSRDR